MISVKIDFYKDHFYCKTDFFFIIITKVLFLLDIFFKARSKALRQILKVPSIFRFQYHL